MFKANDGTNGSELWSTDGTEAGTTMLKEVLPGAGGGVSNASVLFQNLLLFTANDGVHGKELWVSDGTADGTTLLADILLGTSECNPLGYRIIGNTLFFYATTNATGRELWKYDLTPLGTQDIRNGLGIKVWPTASADGQFHITLDGREEPLRIEAFDVLGRLRTWRTLQPGTEILDLSALPVGAYLLRMTVMNSGRGAIERVFVVR